MAVAEGRKLSVQQRSIADGAAGIGRYFRRSYHPFVTIAVILALWQVIGSNLNPIFLSTPHRVAMALWELTSSGELPKNLWLTVRVFIVGLAAAVAIGVPAGLVAGRYSLVSKHTDVAVRTFYSLPSIALFPLFIVWFGIGVEFRLALVFFSGVFPLIITTQAGVKSVDPVLVDVARISGANERQIFLKIVTPSVVAFIAAGFKLSIGRAIVTTVAIEMLTSAVGLGGMMAIYGNYFQTAKYFAPLIAVAALSLLAYWFGDRIERHFSKWRPASLG